MTSIVKHFGGARHYKWRVITCMRLNSFADADKKSIPFAETFHIWKLTMNIILVQNPKWRVMNVYSNEAILLVAVYIHLSSTHVWFSIITFNNNISFVFSRDWEEAQANIYMINWCFESLLWLYLNCVVFKWKSFSLHNIVNTWIKNSFFRSLNFLIWKTM